MENGLPTKNPLRDLEPEDWETLTVPARFQTGGGTTAKEMLILAAVTKALRPRRIFEIGTYNGRTTSVLIMNAPHDCDVLTLDLPPVVQSAEGYIPSDIELIGNRETERFLKRARLRHRYQQIYTDSMQLDANAYRDSIELGFIDGAHTLEYVKNDTEKMAVMMADRGFVFWHDYGGKGEFRPLSRYLESLPIQLYRIRDTSLAWTYARDIKKLVRSSGQRFSAEMVRAAS
jgi:predicted O-methyltransferase YrrM